MKMPPARCPERGVGTSRRQFPAVGRGTISGLNNEPQRQQALRQNDRQLASEPIPFAEPTEGATGSDTVARWSSSLTFASL